MTPARHKQLSLMVLCAAVFLDSLDTSLIGVSLPRIQTDLSMSASTLQWLVSGYVVAYGGFLLLGGRVADLFGRRRTFIAATVAFAVASLCGGLVVSPLLLVALRVIKGIAAAFTAPAAMSLITTTFHEGPERNRALGTFAMTGASGYTFGLIFSGVLTEINWRLVFFLPAVIAVLVLLATPLISSDGSGAGRSGRHLDFGGAATVTSGLILLILGLSQAPQSGWGSTTTITTLLLAVVLLAAFLIIETRENDPLVPLGIFRSRQLSAANLTSVAWAGSTIGWQFIATLYLQHLIGYSPLKTGLAFIPLGIAIVVVARLAAGPLVSRWGVRTVATIGMIAQGTGVLLFLRIGLDTHYAAVMLPALIIHGIGNGLCYPTLNIAGVGGVDDERQGLAAGVITGTYQIGAGIGLAVLAAVLTATTHGSSASAQLHGYRWALLVASMFSAIGVLIALIGLNGPKRPRTVTEEAPQAVLTPAADAV
jgi:EmrB/QacA subfamily drug resistance transporter